MKRKHPKYPTREITEPADHTPSLIGVLSASLLIALWCYPSGAHPYESLYFCVVLAGMGLILFLESARRGRIIHSVAMTEPLIWLLVSLVLFIAVRHRWSPVPALGRESVANFAWTPAVLLTGLGVACFPAKSDPGAPLIAFRRTLVVATIVFGVYAVYQRLVAYPRSAAELAATLEGPVRDLRTQSLLHALREGRIAGRLGNPNLFAAQLALLSVFCVSTVMKDFSRNWRWVGMLAIVAAFVGVGLSRSRGGLLTLVVAIVSCAIIAGRFRPEKAIARIALYAVPLLLAANQAWAAGGWMERLGRIDTIRERLFYWDIAWKVWLREPIFGAGPGGFELYYPMLKSPLARESQYAHSWLFQSAADFGIVGLLLFFAFWFLVLRRLIAANRCHIGREGSPHSMEAAWPLLAALVLAFNGLFEFSLQWREFSIALALFAGLGCGQLVAARPAQTAAAFKPWRPWAGFAASAICAALAISVSLPLARANDANWRGDLAMQARDYREAVTAYLQAVRHEPDNAEWLVSLSGAWVMAGDRQQAWAALARAQTLNPYSASIRAAKASWLERERRFEDALASLGEAVERYPTRVAYRLDRARLLIDLGRPEEARADLEFIEGQRLPVWEFEQEPYNFLRQRTGLAPLVF